MREAIALGHNGEATATRMAFQALTSFQQDDVIEFLKSLQVEAAQVTVRSLPRDAHK
jgi:hypothetical protein